MSQILSAVPPPLLALAGNDIGGLSPGGFIAIGYGHPFMLLLLSAWAVRVSSAALAGEIGRGTMDLLAARPIERWHHVVAGALAILGGLTLLTAAAWTGTSIGLSVRELGVSASQALARRCWRRRTVCRMGDGGTRGSARRSVRGAPR